jgi:hypothetical protein
VQGHPGLLQGSDFDLDPPLEVGLPHLDAVPHHHLVHHGLACVREQGHPLRGQIAAVDRELLDDLLDLHRLGLSHLGLGDGTQTLG